MPTTITGTDGVSQVQTGAVEKEDLFSGFANGVTMADLWRKTSQTVGNEVVDDLEQVDDASFSNLGSSMTQSSGVFTFPETGLYMVTTHVNFGRGNPGEDNNCFMKLDVSSDGGSNYDTVARAVASIPRQTKEQQASQACFVNVTNTANIKIRFRQEFQEASNKVNGTTNDNRTSFVFIRIGDSQ